MIPKKNRTSQKIVDLIFKQGKFINSNNISLKFYINKGNLETRVSFIVPKNVMKSAVGRNMLRRRGYNVVSKYLHDLPLGLNGSFIFGKNSKEIFALRGNHKNTAFLNLENEIKQIISILKQS
ncbi:MAG: ribonuclease P protein component [Candidatus Pacebacteria bacterium]|nr:ribonuclease P protein component [Candidatus Paceibacterota bacterium]